MENTNDILHQYRWNKLKAADCALSCQLENSTSTQKKKIKNSTRVHNNNNHQ